MLAHVCTLPYDKLQFQIILEIRLETCFNLKNFFFNISVERTFVAIKRQMIAKSNLKSRLHRV